LSRQQSAGELLGVSNLGHKLIRQKSLAAALVIVALLTAPARAVEPYPTTAAATSTPWISPTGVEQSVYSHAESPAAGALASADAPVVADHRAAVYNEPVTGSFPPSYPVTPASCDCENGGMPSGSDGSTCEMAGCHECRGVDPNTKPCGNDFWWGCGAFPWENGPGCCDDWVVGPRWDVTVEGMTMFRPNTDLNAIANHDPPTNTPGGFPVSTFSPYESEFDWGVGGRVDITGHLPNCAGYWVEAVYEGINEWNASVVFPKVTPIPPGGTPADSSQQRSIHYVSALQSAEIDFERPPECCVPCVQPFWGVRYIRFGDKLSDVVDQEIGQPPLPSLAPVPVVATDRLNRFNLENNLIGFQLGAHRASLRMTQRFSFEGTCNAGVYYNQIHRQNLMTTTTTQVIGDNTTTFVPGRTDISISSNNDIVELGEVSYAAEASLSAVCQLNKCVALRGGYQFMWIDNLRLADKAYFERNTDGDSLLFSGWHVGIECRR
jgi:Putative beta barrel porin-7 (BBP7)